MGNCQAAEAATVIIQNPANNKIQRIYWSVSAQEIMNSNPGHYVALVVNSRSHDGLPLSHLKLLRPQDTLLIGHVYRLVSFEDVLKEFASKKCVKLGKLLKEKRGMSPSPNSSKSENSGLVQEEEQEVGNNSTSSSRIGGFGRSQTYAYGGGHWKPALQSISEIGT